MTNKHFIIGIFAVFLLAFSINAQSLTIKGRVTDSTGKIVLGATVILKNQETGLERAAVTNANGEFTFSNLRSAKYELIAAAKGYGRTAKAVENINGEVVLTLEPSPLREEVTIVSGSRQEELRESLTTKVDVVTANDMRNTGYATVGEVLRELPGVLTRRNSETAGAAGQQVQGIDSRQVLVLQDGQPILGSRGIKRGVLNLDRQSVERLQSVEVVKGASSALYGSDAIGGVINMISREPSKPFDGSLSADFGNFGVADFSGITSFKKEKLLGVFSLERHKNNGFDLTPRTFDTTGAGYHRYDAYGKLKYQFNDKFSILGFSNSYWNNAIGQSIGESGNQYDDIDEDSQNYGLTADIAITGRAALQVRGYFARFDEITNSKLAAAPFTELPGLLFERYGKLDATFTYVLGERQLIQAGSEWITNRYKGLNRLRNDSGERADTRTFWIQDKVSITSRLTLTVGGRFDSHSIFGNAVSPKIGLNFRASDNVSLRASWGRGFRAPDLGQLYYRFMNPTNIYQVIGNPNLSPEHSGSWQAGGEFNTFNRKLRFGANFFRNDVVNLIDSVSLGFVTSPASLNAMITANNIDRTFFYGNQSQYLNRLLFLYKNLANVYTQGVEFDAQYQLPEGFALSGAYTYLDAKDKNTNLALIGRHPHQGFLKLGWDRPELGFRGNIRGSFYSDWVNSRTGIVDTVGKKFALWDFYAAKSLTKGFEVFGAVDNFFNSQDPRSLQFAANGNFAVAPVRFDAGRTFRLGIRWDFDKEN